MGIPYLPPSQDHLFTRSFVVYEIICSCMDDYTVLCLTNNRPEIVLAVLHASHWMTSYFQIIPTPQAEFTNSIHTRVSDYRDLASCVLRGL